jgi:hypothetical protein
MNIFNLYEVNFLIDKSYIGEMLELAEKDTMGELVENFTIEYKEGNGKLFLTIRGNKDLRIEKLKKSKNIIISFFERNGNFCWGINAEVEFSCLNISANIEELDLLKFNVNYKIKKVTDYVR